MDKDEKFREGQRFQQGVDQLLEVYRLAFDAMADKRMEYQGIRNRMIHDGLYAEELQARGGPIVTDIHIQNALHLNFESMQSLYSAFLMALYHHWERTLIGWMGVKNSSADDKYKWLKTQDIDVDEVKLEDLRFLLRYVKHEGAGDKLRERRPDLFRGLPNYSDSLFIRPHHMVEFFAAVRDAGLGQIKIRSFSAGSIEQLK